MIVVILNMFAMQVECRKKVVDTDRHEMNILRVVNLYFEEKSIDFPSSMGIELTSIYFVMFYSLIEVR